MAADTYTADSRTQAQCLADTLNGLSEGEYTLEAAQTTAIYGIKITKEGDLNVIKSGFVSLGYDYADPIAYGVALIRDTGTLKFTVGIISCGDYVSWRVHP